MPSHLQENRGFKAQELNQQAEYEMPDDIALKVQRHWTINDLVMFVDSEDMPRIPRKLFEMVCEIRVAGVPGPVFRGHIEAVTQLIKIILFVCFVFIIVLSFGAVYKVSTTNQMLATLLGGFLPMVLRTFLAPPAPDVELGTVSFRSKMDEVIKNFCQYWPIHDLPFQLIEEEEPEVTSEENAEVGPPSAADVDSTAIKSGEQKRENCIQNVPKSPSLNDHQTSKSQSNAAVPIILPFTMGGGGGGGGGGGDEADGGEQVSTAIVMNPLIAAMATQVNVMLATSKDNGNNNVGESLKPTNVVDRDSQVDLFVRLPPLYYDDDDWAPSFTEDKDYRDKKSCRPV
jgi:hypothetical protein